MSDSSQPHGLQPTRLLHPWDFPGKSAGVGAVAFSGLRVEEDVKKGQSAKMGGNEWGERGPAWREGRRRAF